MMMPRWVRLAFARVTPTPPIVTFMLQTALLTDGLSLLQCWSRPLASVVADDAPGGDAAAAAAGAAGRAFPHRGCACLGRARSLQGANEVTPSCCPVFMYMWRRCVWVRRGRETPHIPRSRPIAPLEGACLKNIMNGSTTKQKNGVLHFWLPAQFVVYKRALSF